MNTPKKYTVAGLLMGILLVLCVPLAAQDTPNLTDALAALPDAELFNEALAVTGVADALKREAHTVFVPFDTEFGAILSEFDVDMAALTPDEPKMRLLRAIVQQHILVGTLNAEGFRTGQLVTLQGGKLTFQTVATGYTVNQQRVGASVVVTGGALHRVRATLMPDLCSGIAVSGSIGARLGPSFERARIGFLPAGVPVPITGQWTDTYGDVWYRLDKTVATPNKQAAEIWTLGENVTTSGIACDLIANVTPA